MEAFDLTPEQRRGLTLSASLREDRHIAQADRELLDTLILGDSAPLHRFYVRWDLETWEEGAGYVSNGRAFGSLDITPGGTVVIEAETLAEAQEVASYESESLMDVDFLAAGGSASSGYESYPQPFTIAEQDRIGEGRCFFRVTSVVPVGDSAEGSE